MRFLNSIFCFTVCWDHKEKACVSKENIIKHPDKSIGECKALCIADSGCVGFEYGVDHGGSGDYKARDCQLSSGTDSTGCDGVHHNLDLYIKKDCPDKGNISKEFHIVQIYFIGYFIGQKFVGQNCRKFGLVSKILSIEKFCSLKLLSNISIQKSGNNRTKLSKFRLGVENFVRRNFIQSGILPVALIYQ